MTKAAGKILRGLSQAVDYAEGRARRGYRVYVPDDIDVRAIRLRAGLTQAEFSARFGFSLSALRHWEQRTRTPEGPTRAYLCVISRDPEAVERALRPVGNGPRQKRGDMTKISRRSSVRMPSLAEDKAITAAAKSDPDALPLTRKQLAEMVPMKAVRARRAVR